MSRSQRERTVVIAVAPNPRPLLQAAFVLRHKKNPIMGNLLILADPDLAVIRRYGLVVPGLPEDRKYPYPATFLIDATGVVRWKTFGLTTAAVSDKRALEVLARLVPVFDVKSRPYLASGTEKKHERRP